MLVLCFAVALGSSLAIAQAQYGLQITQPLESNGIFIDAQGNSMTEGTWVYGLKIFADDTNSFMGIYDADTTGEFTAANCKDEIGEATQYDKAVDFYDTPIFFSDGVGGVIATGVGYVYYGAAPR